MVPTVAGRRCELSLVPTLTDRSPSHDLAVKCPHEDELFWRKVLAAGVGKRRQEDQEEPGELKLGPFAEADANGAELAAVCLFSAPMVSGIQPASVVPAVVDQANVPKELHAAHEERVGASSTLLVAQEGRFKRLQQHFCHKAIPVVHVALKSATIRRN